MALLPLPGHPRGPMLPKLGTNDEKDAEIAQQKTPQGMPSQASG